jgi:Family of unknown function (DUF6951)
MAQNHWRGDMAKAEILAGICSFKTTVQTTMDGDMCTVAIESECKAIQRLAGQLPSLDPLREFTYRGGGPETFDLAEKYCNHAACPVPVGIIKAIEIEAGLALPQDVSIKLSK